MDAIRYPCTCEGEDLLKLAIKTGLYSQEEMIKMSQEVGYPNYFS